MKIDSSKIISFCIGLALTGFILLIDNQTILLQDLDLKSIDKMFYFSDRPSAAANYYQKLKYERRNLENKRKGKNIREGIPRNPRVDENILIVGFDEPSIERLGRYPWRRNTYSKFMEVLLSAKKKNRPRLVYFDVFLPERQKDNAQDDVELGKTAKKLGNVMWDFFFLKEAEKGIDERIKMQSDSERIHKKYKNTVAELKAEEAIQDMELRMKSVRKWALPKSALIKSGPEPIKEFPTIKPTVAEIANNSYAQAFCNVMPDDDGIKRKMPLVTWYEGNFYPNVDLVAAMKVLKVSKENVKIKLGEYILLKNARTYDYNQKGAIIRDDDGNIKYKSEDIKIPINKRGQMMVNFAGGEGSFPYKPFWEFFTKGMINEVLPSEELAGRILYIGAYGSQGIAYDKHVSPYGDMFGLEAHANTLNTILKRNFLYRAENWIGIVSVIIIGFIICLTVPIIKIWKAAIMVIVLGMAYVIATFIFFDSYNLILKVISPMLTLFLSFTGIILYRVLVEERNRRFLKSAFAQYISPELIEEMYASKQNPALGGEMREMTAYFTDIQGFSTFSEKLTAQQLVELLNEYLTIMTDVLLAERGTLDKYEGDAIIAFIGAPMELPDHALRACKVAINMQKNLLELREKWSSENSPEYNARNIKNYSPEDWAPGDKWPRIVHFMRMRIGINTGEIVTGNMGSETRKNYTMMGDSVNLAARLEAGAKQYGVFTMMSEYTYNYQYEVDGQTFVLRDQIEARFIDNITVVGKSEPVKVYELVALKGELTEPEKQLFEIFNAGIELYLKMEWDQAIETFKESEKIERFPDAKITPSRIYIERCENYKTNPPVKAGETWDGVYRLTSK